MAGKKQSSVEDIIDLMRNGSEAFFPPLSSRHPGIDTDVRAIFKDCADRLEAAWKREVDATAENSSAVGNGAKMLSALKAIVDVFDSKEPMSQQERELVVYNLAKNALTEPPRNCDVIASKNLVDEFCKFMGFDVMDGRNGFADGQYKFMQEHWFEFSKWITMPYAPKEGGKE